MVQVVCRIVEQIVVKSQIQAPSQHELCGKSVKSASQVSASSDPYNRSYDDDRRNLVESIQSTLLAKVEAIEKTISGLDLVACMRQVRDWRTDNFAQQTYQRSKSRKHSS